MGKNGNHLSMPHLLAPVAGVQSGVEPTDYDYAKEASALHLEAWWAVSPYPPAQGQSNVPRKHWNMH